MKTFRAFLAAGGLVIVFAVIMGGINHLVIHQMFSRSWVREPMPAIASHLMEVAVIPESFQLPEMLLNDQSHAAPAGILSIEEAAGLGAYYIWDMFRLELEGAEIDMFIDDWSSSLRAFWQGNASLEGRDGRGAYWVSFLIDARTGERQRAIKEPLIDSYSPQAVDLFRERGQDVETIYLDEEQMAGFLEQAEYFSRLHSQGRDSFTLRYVGSRPIFFQWNPDSAVVVIDHRLLFAAHDETGEIFLQFSNNDASLRSIDSLQHIFLPGNFTTVNPRDGARLGHY